MTEPTAPRGRRRKQPTREYVLETDGRGGVRRVVDARALAEDALALREVELQLAQEPVRFYVEQRMRGLSGVYRVVAKLREDLDDFLDGVDPSLPPTLRGRLAQPDGRPAANLVVRTLRPDYSKLDPEPAWPEPRAVTRGNGAFALDLPSTPLPENGLQLRVEGHRGAAVLDISRADVATSDAGLIVLETVLTPFAGATGDLIDLAGEAVGDLLPDPSPEGLPPPDPDDVDENPADFADPVHPLLLGEGDCARAFRSNSGVVDRFRYSTLIRLVDPQLGEPRVELEITLPSGKKVAVPNPLESDLSTASPIDLADLISLLSSSGAFQLVERSAIDQPLDVTAFHRELSHTPLEVPKASTLSLGYVVHFRQTWIPAGLSLGDLVYSLPLAPGERQEIAVFEEVQEASIVDREQISVEQRSRFRERADSSTQSTFDSALREATAGGSEIDGTSHSWGVGGGGLIGGFAKVLFGVGVAGGYGGTTTSTDTASWQNSSRDFLSSASESFHSQLSRVASSDRKAKRTGIRLASASDRDQVTTKVLANHNHNHSLTMQYWEVLRHFSVISEIDDVELVCQVPLELIPWLPPGHEPELDPESALTRSQLLSRWEILLRHIDVLTPQLARRRNYRRGLQLLEEFTADPTMGVQTPAEVSANIANITLTGTVLPFEEITVTAVTQRGATVGPVRLELVEDNQPDIGSSYIDRLTALETFRAHRRGAVGSRLEANLALPPHLSRNEIVRFDFRRRFRPLALQRELDIPSFGSLADFIGALPYRMLRFTTGQLERELGGPLVWDLDVRLNGSASLRYIDTFQGRTEAVEMSPRLPLAARRLPPVLRFEDLLEIEAVFQHVVRNTVAYSRLVWAAMTDEERAILLEHFTIGMPEGGFDNSLVEVPLLNCVANRVLGFFGNSMLLPFFIPEPIARERKITTRDIQEALLRFHRQAFRPAQTSITLPTRGVLGEAVLGHCNASEKIDLTRFWNWQDSPLPPGSTSKDGTFTPGSIANLDARNFAGLGLVGSGKSAEAPSDLAPLASNVNLIGTVTNGLPTLGGKTPAEQLAAAEKNAKFLAGTGTGIDSLKTATETTLTEASKARKEATDAGVALATTAVDKLPEVLRAQAGLDAETKKAEKAAKAAEDEKKKAEDAAAKAAVKQAEDKQKALTDSAKALAELIGSLPAAEQEAKAKEALTEQLGDLSKLSLVQKAQVLKAFTTEEDTGTPEGDGMAVLRGVLLS